MIKPVSVDVLKQFKLQVTNELNLAKQGQASSFPFIAHQLPSKPLVQPGELFQVMVMGGTNFLSANAVFESKLSLSEKITDKLPVFSNADQVVELVKNHLKPTTRVLCINFAYPLEPTTTHGHLDGILLRATKEHQFTNLVSHPVGEYLRQHLKTTFPKLEKITLANDTICLALSGLQTTPAQSIIGLVVGTGLNMSLFIDDHTIINLEAANFNKFTPTATGLAIDHTSANPGQATLEKETSGAYLYRHYNLMRLLISSEAVELTDNTQLTDLAQNDTTELGDTARLLITRSAAFTAALIAGALEFKSQTSITIVAEGGLFWHGWQYHQIVSGFLQQLGHSQNSLKIVRIDDSTLKGAAQLALGA